MIVAAALKTKGHDIVSVAPNTPVLEIASTIADRRIGAVLVLDAEKRLVGIVSERDVVKALAKYGMAVSTMTAERLMTRDVKTGRLEMTLTEAMRIMDEGYFRHLPIVEEGRLLGIISVRDVVKFEMNLQQRNVDDLTAYIGRAT
jgi:CBS domain-containing protein